MLRRAVLLSGFWSSGRVLVHRLARRCGRASRECASGSRSEQDGGGDEVASREQNSSL